MAKQITAQELYNEFYFEACNRARIKGQDLPNEIEVFQILVKEARKAVADGEAPPDFLYELSEVKPQLAIERERAARKEEREQALRHGGVIDIEDLLGTYSDED
jgi:hypothetical protein